MTEPIACPSCGLVHVRRPLAPRQVASCRRCGSRISARTTDSLSHTAAFALAAMLLYVPANLFPILIMQVHGRTTSNTVWEGVQALWTDGDYIIAMVVFLASILIPFLKLLALFFLVITTRLRFRWWRRTRTWLFKIVEGVGRWAMLDVFALAILVSLVKLQGLAMVVPGTGLFCFGSVVVLTLLASASFDPRLIWERETSDV